MWAPSTPPPPHPPPILFKLKGSTNQKWNALSLKHLTILLYKKPYTSFYHFVCSNGKKQPITHNYGLKAKVTRTRQAGGKPCSNFATLVLMIKITLLTIKMMVQMTTVMLEVPGKASGVGRFPETKVLSKQLAQDTSPSSAPFHQLLRSLQLPPISSHLARSSLWAQWSFSPKKNQCPVSHSTDTAPDKSETFEGQPFLPGIKLTILMHSIVSH